MHEYRVSVVQYIVSWACQVLSLSLLPLPAIQPDPHMSFPGRRPCLFLTLLIPPHLPAILFLSFPLHDFHVFQILHTALTFFLHTGQMSTCLAHSSHATTCPQS